MSHGLAICSFLASRSRKPGVDQTNMTSPSPPVFLPFYIVVVSHLVPRSSLAGLELLKVPVADLHVAVVLVEALREGLGGAGAVVVLRPRVLGRSSSLDLLGGRSRLGGAAAEEATDGVANGGADGDTTVVEDLVSSVLRRQGVLCSAAEDGRTYAAVLAIWPKSPGPWLTGAAC